MKPTTLIWIVLTLLLLSTNQLMAQPNQVANYGFEASSSSVTSWTTSNHVGTSSIVTSGARSGSNAYSNVTSSTTTTGYIENNQNISVPNNQYLVIIAYYKVSSNNSSCRAQVGVSGNMCTAVTPSGNNTFYRITHVIQNTSGSAQDYRVRLNCYRSGGSGSRTFIWDDVIAYVSSSATADVTNPNAPTNGSINYTSGSATVTWTNNTDNSGGSGLARTVLLRQTTTTCPLTAPTLTANRIYTSSTGNGVSSDGSWTVLDTISSTSSSYVDNTIVNGSSYVYAIVHEDLAYNHSTAIVEYIPLRVSATPSPANASTSVSRTTSLSWAATCGADAYDVYVSTSQTDVDNQSVSSRVASNQTATSYSFSSELNGLTTYYWKVVPKNTAGNEASGCTTWSFTTVIGPLGFNTSRSANITYNSIITSGNSFDWSSTYNADDQMSNALDLNALGFTGFRYQNSSITSLRVNSNGFITFDPSSGASYTNSFSSRTLIIAPFWEDLVCQGYMNTLSQSDQYSLLRNSMKYLITGEAGSQVLTIEWSEMEIYNNAGPSINFQLKLYEQDDKIEFVYGKMFGFNGTINYTYTYSAGLSGNTVSSSPTAGQAFIQNTTNVLNFSNTNTTNLSELPDCYSSILFTPSSATSASASARSISNDECADAITLAIQNGVQNDFCQIYSSKTATASSGITTCSATTPGTADDDVWFKFTVTTAGNFGVNVNGSGSYNPVIQLFSGNCAALTAINCVNTTGNGLIETLTANSLEEGTYYIRIYDANTSAGGSGNFAISVYSILPALANDDCDGATSLTIGETHASGSTSNASASSGIATCTASTPGTADDDVWYSFTATSTVTRITVNGGSAYNAVVQLFSGSCGSLTNLTCVSSTGAAGVETLDYATTIGVNYKVRVYHSANGATPTSGISILVTNVTPACPALSSPANATNNLNRTSAQTLTWAASTSPSIGTFTYSVEVSTNSTFTSLVSLTGNSGLTTTSYTIAANTLSAGTTYYWRVIATNANGSSSGCSYYTMSTIGTTPSCVTLNAPTNQTTNEAVSTTLSWSAGSGSPTSYDVYMSTNASDISGLNSVARVSTSQTGTTYAASGLLNNTTYYWVAIAKNGSGNASSCETFSFSTIPAAPSNDNCSGATVLSSTSSSLVAGTSLNASQSQVGLIGTANDDVWYTFVASSTTHNIQVIPSSGFNAVIELFSGSCGSLTSIEAINEYGNSGTENLAATSLTIGQTYFVRVYDFGSTTPTNSGFSIRINDVDLALTSFVSPSSNNCGNTTVTVTIQNQTATNLDFTVNPYTVSGSVTDPSSVVTTLPSVTLNTGTLSAGASQQVTLTTTYSVQSAGSYRYAASISADNDNNSSNNSLSSTLQNITVPLPYILSGTGSYCAGGTGVTFSLSGSQSGTNYQLFRSGTAVSDVVSGTGSGLSFPNVTVDGSYRVVAINASTQCRSYMSASAVVTVNPLWLGVDNNWNNTANWCGGVVPATNANIIISGSATIMPQLPGDVTVNNLELTESTKQIVLNGSTLTVNGTISGDGNIKGGTTSGLVINGSGNMGEIKMDQSVPGTSNVLNNLTVNVGSTNTNDSIQISTATIVTGTLQLNNGLLITNNQLTLASNASGTARVGSIATSAAVRGNVISQRYVPAITRRYRAVSPNTQSFVYSDLKDDVFITGSGGAGNGFDASSNNSASIFTYQESTTGGRGWKAVTNITQGLSAGNGAIVFVRGDRTLASPAWYTPPFVAQNEVTIDFVGAINSGNISPTITYTSTGDATADGWNLVGNPYPSQIDWSLITKSNLNSFVYILNPNTNSYVASSGSVKIASGQAFFVQANAASPSITFTESCKTSSAATSYFKTETPPLTVIMIKDSINSDMAVLNFETGASNNFIATEDAIKFSNSSMNMGFVAEPGKNVQINTVPFLTNTSDTFTIFANASNGNYTLNFSNFDEVPANKLILLRDLFTNVITDLRAQQVYSFNISGVNQSQGNRFQLIIQDNSALPVEFVSVNAKAANQDAIVEWATATEINNEKFVVERSFNGSEFEPVGVVKGAGNSAIKINYSFTDINAIAEAKKQGVEQVYYRIKQVDFTGESETSNTVLVNLSNSSLVLANALEVFPNPTNGYVTIRNTNQTSLGEISIIDLNGKEVSKVNTISNALTINLGNLNYGVYILKTSTGITHKLIIE